MHTRVTFFALATAMTCVNLLGCQRSDSADPPRMRTANEQALDDIQSFAAKLCKTAEASGGTLSADASLSAEGQLEGLVKKIANLGLKGAAEIQARRYEGVAQADLAPLLANDGMCRERVFSTLQAKLVTSVDLPRDPGAAAPKANTATAGSDSVILQDVNAHGDIKVQR